MLTRSRTAQSQDSKSSYEEFWKTSGKAGTICTYPCLWDWSWNSCTNRNHTTACPDKSHLQTLCQHQPWINSWPFIMMSKWRWSWLKGKCHVMPYKDTKQRQIHGKIPSQSAGRHQCGCLRAFGPVSFLFAEGEDALAYLDVRGTTVSVRGTMVSQSWVKRFSIVLLGHISHA